jgi:hypothetical protein
MVMSMRHLFIVTYGRSGSTALQRTLNRIPGYCIRGENGGILVNFVTAAATLERKRREPGRTGDTDEHPWFGIQDTNIAELRKGLADLFVRTVLCPPPDCRTIGFKGICFTPIELDDDSFTQLVDFLLNEFEDARIIFNTRDALQVAQSAWWAERPSEEVIDLVEHSNRRFAKAHKRYPGSTKIIDHSEYDRRPEGLASLLEWLGEELPVDQLTALADDRLMHCQPRSTRWRRRIGQMLKR